MITVTDSQLKASPDCAGSSETGPRRGAAPPGHFPYNFPADPPFLQVAGRDVAEEPKPMKIPFIVTILLVFNLTAVGAASDPPPVLVSQLPDRQIELSWPGTAVGYLVEETAALGPAALWKWVLLEPEVAGGRQSVTVAPGPHDRFFRLRLALPPCPPEGTIAPRAALQITEVGMIPAPGGYPWVELRHVGRCGNVPLWGLHVRNRTHVLSRLRSEDIAPGQFVLVVCDDPLEDGEPLPDELLGDPANPSGRIVHAPREGAGFDPTTDECVLGWTEWGGDWQQREEIVSSVKWGDLPERGTTLNTSAFPLSPGGSIGLDGLEPGYWVRYQTPTPGAENGLPSPIAYYPFEEAVVPAEEATLFAWLDFRTRALAYRLQVAGSPTFDSPTADQSVQATRFELRPSLPPGEHFWRVRAEAGERVSAWSAPQRFTIVAARPAASAGLAELAGPGGGRRRGAALAIAGPSQVFPPAKDTKMLCMECRAESGAHAWDREHEVSAGGCDHEKWYATVNAVHIVNLMYGGLLAQDQIAWRVFGSSAGGPIDPAGHLGHGLNIPRDQIQETLQWALGGNNTVRTYARSFMTETDALTWLSERRVFIGEYSVGPGEAGLGTRLFVATGGSFGYTDNHGVRQLDLHVHDPQTGHRIWVPWRLVTAAWVPDDSAATAFGTALQGDEADAADLSDADGDGLLAVDESLRFGTDPRNADSDGDGVPDKIEIYSYTFGQGIVPRKADIDGDGLRAELDPDSDNDGCLDGEEDRNHNGKYRPITLVTLPGVTLELSAVEEGETDPFWKDEIRLSLHAEKAQLEFKQCTTVSVELLQHDGAPWTNQVIHLMCDPAGVGYFKPLQEGSVEGPDILVITDENGRARAEFCALEAQGPAKIKATFERCEGAEDTVKEQSVEIVSISFVFVRQETAVLTGPMQESPYEVGAGTGYRTLSKPCGTQSVSGRFFHPRTTTPGRSIHGIEPWVLDEAAGDVTLLVNGNVVSNRVWIRTSPQDNADSWEVRVNLRNVASERSVYDEGLRKHVNDVLLPRYLVVQVGYRTLLEPLVWWLECAATGTRYHHQGICVDPGCENSEPPLVCWRLQSPLATQQRAGFFFGDSRRDTTDPRPGLWPQLDRTGVGFIPIGAVGGAAVKTWISEPDISRAVLPTRPQLGESVSVVGQHIDAFARDKRFCAISSPNPGTATAVRCVSQQSANEFNRTVLEGWGPMPLNLLEEVRFQRDYTDNELEAIRAAGLQPPAPHFIRMLSRQ